MTNQKLTDGEADFWRLIEIDAYLTEAKLAKVLREIVPDGWLGDQVQVVGSRFRWDTRHGPEDRFRRIGIRSVDHQQPGTDYGHNACMDPTQTKIIELLREVHLLAIKEVERLNLRISELENEHRQPTTRTPIPKAAVNLAPSSLAKPNEMLNERQVADYLNMSVASVRKWRLFRKGPKFVKLGRAIRYRRIDVEAWLSSCLG